MRTHFALAAVLGCVLFSSCTLVDFRLQPDRHERNRALVSGFASVGWPESNDFLKLRLLRPNRGSLLYFQLWKLLRVDIGLVGLGVGVGPLDLGLGVLLHQPRPPHYIDCCDESDDECDDCDNWGCDGDCEWEDDDEDDDDEYAAAYFIPRVHHEHLHKPHVSHVGHGSD